QFIRDLVERLRALLLLQAAGDTTLLDMSDDELAVLQEQVAGADLGALLAWTRLFGELDFQLRTSPYGQLPLELAVVEAIAAPAAPRQVAAPVPRAAAPRAAAAPVRRPPTEAPPEPARSAAPEPARPAPAPAEERLVEPAPVDRIPADNGAPFGEPEAAPAEAMPLPAAQDSRINAADSVQEANADAAALEYVESIWPDVVRDVRVYDKTLQALLNSGVRPVDVREHTIVLEVANEWLLGRLEKPNLRQTVEKVISKHMQGPYFISCTVETQNRVNKNELREQIRKTRKDPLVKAAMNIFDADIIRVESDEENEE
ncbi:MAG TPA: DNA polymerase III subunit gamma/tau, partial [Roseiflexaceae bacterium]|nr:DNA polymerase III subunit gamma/tau [Roseiflexaceae bacterium]